MERTRQQREAQATRDDTPASPRGEAGNPDSPQAHTPTGGRYDMNVGRLIDDYPDFAIRGHSSGFGYSARRRIARGPRGRDINASSLDELADKMDQARADPARLSEIAENQT